MFDCLPENKTCKIQGISRVSRSCNDNVNERNIKKTAYVIRTTNLVDVSETCSRLLQYVPLPLEEVLLNLKMLCAKGPGNT